jgi:hypothetical protein
MHEAIIHIQPLDGLWISKIQPGFSGPVHAFPKEKPHTIQGQRNHSLYRKPAFAILTAPEECLNFVSVQTREESCHVTNPKHDHY